MTIYEQVDHELKTAMKARDQDRLDALRNIRAGFLTEMKKNNAKDLADDRCIAILRTLEKQRKESIAAFEAGDRPGRAASEKRELSVIQEFLPNLADAETTRVWVQAAIESSGAESARDMGKVMGAIMKDHKGEVDGKIAQKIAQELLSS